MLKFSNANAKIKALSQIDELAQFLENRRRVYSFDLLSGWSCPGASDCLSKVVQIGDKKKIKDGPNCQFRCFSASQEVTYPAVYKLRKNNYDAIKSLYSALVLSNYRKTIAEVICNQLNNYMPENLGICRIHVAGDFFNHHYMHAWILLAQKYPDRLFYAYTKSLPFWLMYRDLLRKTPNFVLTASRGGRYDNLIGRHRLRSVKVVYHPSETDLPIDHDDSFAARPSMRKQNFALLIHGTQPKGSDASKATQTLKKEKIKYSYGK